MNPSSRPAVALAVAGFDPTGGAGLAADLAAFARRGVWGTAVLTAATVQTTAGVERVAPLEPELVREQIERVCADIRPDAVKLGMLGSAAIAATVAAALVRLNLPNIVLDPLLHSWDGADLSGRGALDVLRDELLPLATLVTPNAPEAQALTGIQVTDRAGAQRAAERLVRMGASAALVKGGHLANDSASVPDVLCLADGSSRVFENPRQSGLDPHGTGCALSSLIAAGLALGEGLIAAVEQAELLLSLARETPLALGRGKPLLRLWPR